MKRILFVSINYIHNGCCNNHIHIVAFSLYRNVPVLCAGIFSWEIQLNFYSKRMTSKFETRVSKLEQLTSDNQQLLESVTATNFERLLAHSQGCSLSLSLICSWECISSIAHRLWLYTYLNSPCPLFVRIVLDLVSAMWVGVLMQRERERVIQSWYFCWYASW